MGRKQFIKECDNSRSTASVLRLVSPWLTLLPPGGVALPVARHKVHADSAFASVTTAVHLRRRGMDFAGPVKTAHSNFPRSILVSQLSDASVNRGAHEAAYGEYDLGGNGPPVPLAAVGWKDAKVQTFIDTNASTLAGAPAIKRRVIGDGPERRQGEPLEVPRPQCVQKAHESLNAM
jgi:hypothetical protein